MLVEESPLSGVFIIEPKIHEDDRGHFFESYNKKDLEKYIPNIPNFVQDNISFSKKNVLRGLHYQEHNSQAKLIKVNHGEIFDVAVNIDKKSHQYMNYFSIILNDSNNKQLYIPENFAHGFLVLSDSAQVSYKTSNFYDAKSEKTILWNDKKIGIDWPIKTKPLLSKKDDFK
jgi:dTDP-4-dehydrorhamnose 3,5-epimerase